MIDFRYTRMRENTIKDMCGIPKDARLRSQPRDTTDIYSVYFNPSNGHITGIRDNENNVFYHWTIDGEDLIRLINKINFREAEFTKVASTIDSITKEFTERQMKLYQSIDDYEEQIYELKKRIAELEKEVKDE